MGIFDKAKDLAAGHPDKTDAIVDRAGDLVDEKTGGKHAEHVDRGQDFVRGQLGGEQGEAVPSDTQPDDIAPTAPAGEGGSIEENPPV